MNKEIFKMVKDLNNLYEVNYNYIKVLVLDLINNNNKDIKLIEYYLDTLLNIPTEKSYKLYIKLCNYYKNVNKDNAEFYIKEYKKIME